MKDEINPWTKNIDKTNQLAHADKKRTVNEIIPLSIFQNMNLKSLWIKSIKLDYLNKTNFTCQNATFSFVW